MNDERIEQVEELSQQTLAINAKQKQELDQTVADKPDDQENQPKGVIEKIKSVVTSPIKLFKRNAVKNNENKLVDRKLTKS